MTNWKKDRPLVQHLLSSGAHKPYKGNDCGHPSAKRVNQINIIFFSLLRSKQHVLFARREASNLQKEGRK
jgi:hypothetical protein